MLTYSTTEFPHPACLSKGFPWRAWHIGCIASDPSLPGHGKGLEHRRRNCVLIPGTATAFGHASPSAKSPNTRITLLLAQLYFYSWTSSSPSHIRRHHRAPRPSGRQSVDFARGRPPTSATLPPLLFNALFQRSNSLRICRRDGT